MISTTAGDKAILSKNHFVTNRIEIYDRFMTLLAQSGTGPTDLILLDGMVTVDRRAAHLRSFTAELVDRDFNIIGSPITTPTIGVANRNIVRLYRGYKVGATDKEWLLGTFVIEEFSPTEVADGVVRINIGGRDVSCLCAENPWLTPFSVVANNPIKDTLEAMWGDRVIGFGSNALASAYVMPNTKTYYGGSYDNNPWQEMQAIADAAGQEIYVDETGQFKSRLYPTTGATAMSYNNSSRFIMNGPISRPGLWSRTYNGVVVRVNAPWLLSPIYAESYVTTGTMSMFGPMGQRPRIIERPSITTIAQAQAVADAKVAEMKMASEEVSFDALVLPGLEAGDTIRLTAIALKLNSTAMIVDAFNIPLNAKDVQTIVGRKALTS